MNEAKQRAAEKAIEYVENDMIIGVGTGSTVAYFIDALGRIRNRIKGAVSSSEQSTARLKQHGITVLELNHTGTLPLYVDGADECDPHKRLIKGGGASLTREKIIAEASEQFICIIDPSKQVPMLGKFPLPIEVIPMARSLVARQIMARTGGQPVWREGVVTDNGNFVLDVHHLCITDPVKLEQELNQIPGVICVGLFARRCADVVIIGSEPPQVL
ncbi:ribose-5-phosphate isomerase RpiA [Xylella taiwanensis]|uniref:Ribose-5-phosphate isomerase A n=1 Tax=Xylella taiwanensis TaxID=1444770 RepID=Z9JMZ9_9GAMM|nr:ribose-5-phosphate isomerase RpiA [Xylella taiwanensis]AXI83367.1 ribose 5-phosphate isomerase [Xylella taiwanensis]EWS79117.1 ribose 5-phosphate isomerase [Xylella taiwanensis]MCD8456433.1 ribose-5-phosphate isomerase RpiA [Xylella taiwanensis]MCD8458840.1 ribose-5-phosphate isomerase RpiA [Xylella taiwanensis]MCD8460977.1 ribose-5-phosphate isomerase RpiA [Xylella taiwanensis]